MIYSLRLRLLLTLIAVIVIALGTVAFFTSRITASEFRSYIDRGNERSQKIVDTVLNYYRSEPDTANDQHIVAQLEQQLGERVIITDEKDVVLAASDPTIVERPLDWQAAIPSIVVTKGTINSLMPAASVTETVMVGEAAHPAADLIFVAGPTWQVAPQGQGARLSVAGEPFVTQGGMTTSSVIGDSAIIIRQAKGETFNPVEAGFISSVNHTLTLAISVAGIAAILLAAWLSRRILGPVETLIAAARRMEKGDLSQRVAIKSRDEIGELIHAFNAMADGLARLSELRQHMQSDIAHELRTPITNIRAYLEACHDGVAEPSPELLASLYEEALLLNRLVDDLQELTLAEAGQLSLVRQATDLRAVVQRSIALLGPAATEKAIAIEHVAPTELPAIEADEERLTQVLRNLLVNALRHTGPGGSITVRSRLVEQEIQVSVSDTGCGIAPDHMPYIFERFFRADPSRNRRTGGAGLGLAIVKQLVELHGGRVWAESTLGVGSTFAFSLPLPKTALAAVEQRSLLAALPVK